MVVKNLRASRENYLFLKQKDVALILNVSFQSISNWENERDIIPLSRLIKYANFFDFSLDFLFGTSNNVYNSNPINIDLKSIGTNLLKLRKLNNMSQTDIIKKLNISKSSYSDYENGKRLIPTMVLFGLTTIYKPFSIDALFNRKNQDN